MIVGKERTPKTDEVPGPGNYPLVYQRIAKGVRIGTEKKLGISNLLNLTSPGPAAYSSCTEKSITPKYSFGTGKRHNIINSSTVGPGPGNYKVPCKFANVPRYSIRRQKTEEFQYV